ncbi:MAG TPA: tetratricopeptide repeat protein [Planctomycetaceae bacterium]|nr:tetratricopeptide repeat protein [Planctomycetaceae bacterium]
MGVASYSPSQFAAFAVAVGLTLGSMGCAWRRTSPTESSAQAHRLVNEALAAEDAGDQKKAENLLWQALKLNPENPETRWEMAKLMLSQDRDDAAAIHLRKLCEAHPDDARGYVQLARMMYNQHRYGDADRMITFTLERDPQCVEAMVLRGELDEVWGRDERAFETYHRVLLADPENVDARLRIAGIQIRRGKAGLAAPLLRGAQQLPAITPDQSKEVQWLLGLAYGQAGRWSESVAALSNGLPTGASAEQLYQLAYAEYRAGHLQLAGRRSEEALRLEPQYQPARQLLSHLEHAGNAEARLLPASYTTPRQ